MRYAGREYRVVCAQTADKQLLIDIVPADKTLHRLILQERQQRDKSIHEIAGSIKLYDMGEGNRPEILFLPPENGSLSPVELSGAEENRLRYKITARFEEMMAQNQDSTIIVQPHNIVDVAGAPQSPQEEQNRILSERQQHAIATRAQTQEYLKRRDEKYGKAGLCALQIKQLTRQDY